MKRTWFFAVGWEHVRGAFYGTHTGWLVRPASFGGARDETVSGWGFRLCRHAYAECP